MKFELSFRTSRADPPMSARLHAPSPPGSPSRRSVPAMSHRPFKKRDWDAELAKIGVPSDSPMRLIQRRANGDGDGVIGIRDEANNDDIVAASEGDRAPAGADVGGDIGTPEAATGDGGGGAARRGWSPARPFDLGADRSPFLTDVAPSPKEDDDHLHDEPTRWRPGATPLAVGGMLGDVYGRDDDDDGHLGDRTGDDGIEHAARVSTRGTPTGWATAAQPIAFVGSVADAPIAATWLRRLRAEGFNVAAHVGPPHAVSELPRGVVRASNARHAAELALGFTSRASNPKAWAPGARAKDCRDACVRNQGAPQPRPLLIARFANESSFSHAMDVLLGTSGGIGGTAGGDDLSGKLIVVNATPTTPAVSQRVGAKLAALGVPYVHVALAGGAAEIETGDAHAFVAYVDGKVPAHVSRRCGTIAAGLKSLKSQGGVGGIRTRDVVADECERALRVLSQDKPTVVARDDCAACCDLRLVSLLFFIFVWAISLTSCFVHRWRRRGRSRCARGFAKRFGWAPSSRGASLSG